MLGVERVGATQVCGCQVFPGEEGRGWESSCVLLKQAKGEKGPGTFLSPLPGFWQPVQPCAACGSVLPGRHWQNIKVMPAPVLLSAAMAWEKATGPKET